MTQDHLFPQGLAIPGQRRVTQILHQINPNYRGRQGTFLAQNGVKKATLCADCNNRVLGTELDPALISLYRAASAAMEHLRYPVAGGVIFEGVNLNRVARAVAGHLLALDDVPRATYRPDRLLRRFVLDRRSGLHPALRFHMWLYPFHKQGMLKDLNHFEFGAKYDPMWICAFKTYPLAFGFSTEVQNPTFRLPGSLDLTDHITADDEQLFHLRLMALPIVDNNWPFAPHPKGGIFTGMNSSITTEPYVMAKKSQARTAKDATCA